MEFSDFCMLCVAAGSSLPSWKATHSPVMWSSQTWTSICRTSRTSSVPLLKSGRSVSWVSPSSNIQLQQYKHSSRVKYPSMCIPLCFQWNRCPFSLYKCFYCFDCVQNLSRSLRRDGFHLLKTRGGWNTSGMKTSWRCMLGLFTVTASVTVVHNEP